MHSPETLAFSIKSPFRKLLSVSKDGTKHYYRNSIVDIWHVDPCRGSGGDDSCGWFMRSHHGDPKVLERIRKRFEFDWDKTFTCSDGKVINRGYFDPHGNPAMSTLAIAHNLFFLAALEVFGTREKSARFLQRNLSEIMLFAENPTDSLRDSIENVWGSEANREHRISGLASIIYGWILRASRPWWKHPKWHIVHFAKTKTFPYFKVLKGWEIHVPFISAFKRWAFSRCCKCGKGFRFHESPTTANWNSKGPRWFRSEEGVYHSDCSGGDFGSAKRN